MKPIGSGPFRFKTWEPGRRIVLEKFPQYFGPGPYVDEVEYLIVPNTANAVQLLQEGRIDTMIGRPPGNTRGRSCRARRGCGSASRQPPAAPTLRSTSGHPPFTTFVCGAR
jgi:ABC-type transport system substrate-binding protein